MRVGRVGVWLLAALVLGSPGCIDFWYGIKRQTPCAAAHRSRIRDALQADPSLQVDGPPDLHPEEFLLELSCDRDGVTANLDLTTAEPPILRVSVGALSMPEEAERKRWREAVSHICSTLESAIPALGPWETEDTLDPDPWGDLAFLCVLGAGAALYGGFIWLIVKKGLQGPR